MFGYVGKIIDIDLTREKITVRTLDKRDAKMFFGGRGLATWILWRELGNRWSEIDPLREENLFIVMTGPLTGYYPGMKICISGKSPQSNGVIGSTLSSKVGIELKAAGYDGIILRGKAEEPSYIFIYDDEIDIRRARKYWGLRSLDTLREIMRDTYSELRERELKRKKGIPKEPGIIYIGPAGENKVRTAAVFAKFTHAAGYGGYGAVMGSKNVKAIVVKGTGRLPDVFDPEGFKEKLIAIHRRLLNFKTFRAYGTGPGGYVVGAILSAEPVKNWQEEWHDRKSMSVTYFESKAWVKKYWGDYGCPLACMKISILRYGKYKGAISDLPDYELQAYLGPNLGIFEPEDIIYLSYLADELGVDAINTGNAMAFAAELYERGILSKEELGGLDLKWGNTEAFAKLMEMIAYREGIGDILAEGTYRAALKLSKIKGEDLTKYAITVKGVAVGAHGVRSRLDFTNPISYAVSVEGGDHTSTADLPAKGETGELFATFIDSAVICMFTARIGFANLIEFTNIITGFNWTPEKWMNEIGLRIIHLQRALLLLGGPDIFWNPMKDDDNPLRFYEPLPSGPFKGQTITREEVNDLKKKYYAEIGYDEFGIPKSEVLKKLGLEDVDKALEKVRERIWKESLL